MAASRFLFDHAFALRTPLPLLLGKRHKTDIILPSLRRRQPLKFLTLQTYMPWHPTMCTNQPSANWALGLTNMCQSRGPNIREIPQHESRAVFIGAIVLLRVRNICLNQYLMPCINCFSWNDLFTLFRSQSFRTTGLRASYRNHFLQQLGHDMLAYSAITETVETTLNVKYFVRAFLLQANSTQHIHSRI